MMENLTTVSWVKYPFFLFTATLVYILVKGLYNLYFHPLRHIPGPKRAAFSWLYEFWFDVIQDGQYIWEVERLHNKYGDCPKPPISHFLSIAKLVILKGPIVRINPDSIHVRDSSFFSTIYAYGRKTDKDRMSVDGFGLPTASIATIDHDLHRARKGYVSHYFSKRAITSIEPIIHARVSRLCERMDGFLMRKQILTLDNAFSALTGDIICQRMYGDHFGFLDVPNFRVFATESTAVVCSFYHFSRFFPYLNKAIRKFPLWLQKACVPAMEGYHGLQQSIKEQLAIASAEREKGKLVDSVMLASLTDPEIPPAERTIGRLVDEGAVILMAGTETTARALSVGVFYLLHNPDCLKALREELRALPPHEGHQFPLLVLESLPYLGGVVCESLRLSYGVITRLPRVSQSQPLHYGEYVIPAGTPVSQSHYFVHTDPNVYPDPFKFDPERWIRAKESGVNLSLFLANFSRGTRQCIGMQMAYAELFITLARIAMSFEMQLHDTTVKNVTVECDRILGLPHQSRFGLASAGNVKVRVIGKPTF